MTRMKNDKEKEAECLDETFPVETEEGVNDINDKNNENDEEKEAEFPDNTSTVETEEGVNNIYDEKNEKNDKE